MIFYDFFVVGNIFINADILVKIIKMSEEQIGAALDLTRRLPPQLSAKNLDKVIDLLPDAWEELYNQIDTPILVRKDDNGREFLCNSYNQDGDSYRSHWDNAYYPELEDGVVPPSHLRSLEVAFNNVFQVYVNQYYSSNKSDTALSSVYLFESSLENRHKNDFNGIVLIKNQTKSLTETEGGTWDSMHLIEATHDKQSKCHYKSTSTILLYMNQADQNVGKLNLSGNFTIVRNYSKNPVVVKSIADHIKAVGSLVEDIENNMRSSIQEIYFSKTKYGFDSCRSTDRITNDQHKKDLARSMREKMDDKSNIAPKIL